MSESNGVVRPTIFTAVNHHAADCGEPPPTIRSDNTDVYVGYFQNKYGEQFLFEYDRKAGVGRLRGGDAGWANVYEVVQRGEGPSGYVAVPGLVLNPSELAWVTACWVASHQAANPIL